ncbi:hypothetical protein K503DRAFT_548318 [Rhizopogon vinicolor AM-OR11-026]|uniref:Uncharacterized protein n=1 Tax=Rhizopogon vinicolor AM-OR11-026 TaxID=1314800 RepID=A0A1B7N8B0_9AGAM|nr:hypothetical protein K503DRAFT_548318 [Rhizopogon vinicolor AM-OR11-026]
MECSKYIERGVQTASPPLTPSATAPDLPEVLVPQASGSLDSYSRPPQEIKTELPSVEPEMPLSPSSTADDDAYNQFNLQNSPASLMCAPLISRRVPRRKLFLVKRRPEVKDVERRVVSMPGEKSVQHVTSNHPGGSRVVSMPEYIATAADLSLDTTVSFSAGISFESGVEKRRVKVCPAPSDVPRTPSPPSSPESVLIIDSDVQLSDGFLRKKYFPKITAASGNGWMTWASSPPRAIPALHGPLSLPYARCPSGAEGTIIEEPGNVSRMIWGLGPDESSRQYRADSEHTDDETHHRASPHLRVPPRVQKKNVLHKPLQVRAAANTKKSYQGDVGGGASTTHSHLDHELRIHGYSQGSHLLATKDERPSHGLPFPDSWIAGPGIPTVREQEVQEKGSGSSFNDQELLLRVALAQHSLQNTALNQGYPEGLKPVFPVSNHPRTAPAYPKIFVEPRLNEAVNAAQRQSALEIAQQYRRRQEFHLKQQSALPTPPSSSSPQWSSNFSPYRYPSISPEIDIQGTLGLPHHILQAQLPFVDATLQARKFLYDRQDNNVVPHSFDGNGECGPMPSTRHSSDVSSGLANYLRDLQTLSSSVLAQQARYSDTTSPHLPQHVAAARRPVSTGHTVVSMAPPSPESPGSRPRSASYQQPRSVPLAQLMQRHLSSVPEEDISGLADASSTSGHQFIDGHQRSLSSRAYHGDNAAPRVYHQEQYLDVPSISHHGRVPSTDTTDYYEAQPYTFPHGTSPAKVRLPPVQDREEYVYQSHVQPRSKGVKVADLSQQLKKKPRGRKIRSDV